VIEAGISFKLEVLEFFEQKLLLSNDGAVLTKRYSNAFKEWKLKDQNNMEFT